MAVNESRSLNTSLNSGSTDGKYRKVRPNTEVAKGTGEDLTLANRRGLNPYWNYDYIDQETSSMVEPGSMTAPTGSRPATDVADTFNNKMGASN